MNYLGEILMAVGLTLVLGYPGRLGGVALPLYYVAAARPPRACRRTAVRGEVRGAVGETTSAVSPPDHPLALLKESAPVRIEPLSRQVVSVGLLHLRRASVRRGRASLAAGDRGRRRAPHVASAPAGMAGRSS